MSSLWFDLRYACRQLRRAPGYTTAALLTLSLAIGGLAAMAGILRATILNPTPFPHPEQLVVVHDVNLRGAPANGIVDLARAIDLAHVASDPAIGRLPPLFANLAYFYYDEPTLVAPGALPAATTAEVTSGNFFETIDAAPLLGRTYSKADDQPSSPEVAVISAGFWQRVFRGNPNIVGTQITLGGKPTTIIGIMAPSFDYYASAIDLWKPAKLPVAGFGVRGGRFLNIIGRLTPGTSVHAAKAALQVLAARLSRAYPATDADWGFAVLPLRESIFAEFQPALLLITGALALVLLIACVNVAGLQLSRHATRAHELAVRRALGSTRLRLLQQLLFESALLLVGGSVVGIFFAFGLLRLLPSLLPPGILPIQKAQLDLPALTAAIVIAAVTGLGCCLLPMVRVSRWADGSLQGGRSLVSGSRRMGRIFATAQIAFALVLLTVTVSLLQSLHHLLRMPLGYSPQQVLSTSVHLPFGTQPAAVHRLYTQLAAEFATLPGTDAVGAIDALPLTSFTVQRKTDIAGRALTPHHDAVIAESRTITPGYATTMGIPLVAGRLFNPRDSEAHMPAVVMVNQAFAQQYFPNQHPIGQRLISQAGSAEIVGVLGNVLGTNGSLSGPVSPEIYQPEQGYWPDMHFVLRTHLPQGLVEPAMRRALASLDRGAALGPVEPLSLSVHQALAQPSLSTSLLSVLSALSLLLVITGVYGVCAFAAAQRTREIALRLALGATRGSVLQLMLRDALQLLGFSLPLGGAAAFAASRLTTALGQGLAIQPGSIAMGTHAPLLATSGTLAAATFLLVVVVLVAGWLPASRAAATEPAQVLAAE